MAMMGTLLRVLCTAREGVGYVCRAFAARVPGYSQRKFSKDYMRPRYVGCGQCLSLSWLNIGSKQRSALRSLRLRQWSLQGGFVAFYTVMFNGRFSMTKHWLLPYHVRRLYSHWKISAFGSVSQRNLCRKCASNP